MASRKRRTSPPSLYAARPVCPQPYGDPEPHKRGGRARRMCARPQGHKCSHGQALLNRCRARSADGRAECSRDKRYCADQSRHLDAVAGLAWPKTGGRTVRVHVNVARGRNGTGRKKVPPPRLRTVDHPFVRRRDFATNEASTCAKCGEGWHSPHLADPKSPDDLAAPERWPRCEASVGTTYACTRKRGHAGMVGRGPDVRPQHFDAENQVAWTDEVQP